MQGGHLRSLRSVNLRSAAAMRLSQPSKQLIKALQACMRSAAASTTHLGGVVARSSEAHCYSSNRGSGSASSSGDGNDAAGGGILADFEQRVAGNSGDGIGLGRTSRHSCPSDAAPSLLMRSRLAPCCTLAAPSPLEN